MIREKRLTALLPGIAAFLLASTAIAEEKLTVFAAASMTDAVTEIADLYEARTGQEVVTSFASSAALARQIETLGYGDVYISASPRWTTHLAAQEAILTDSILPIAGNQLVLASAQGAETIYTPELLETLIIRRLDGHGRLAIGEPESVPAGIYAKQALTRLGLWPALSRRLAYTDNVRAALALVERQEAALGIVYKSDLATVNGVEQVYAFPAESHDPIVYTAALITGAQPAAKSFLGVLIGPEALDLFKKHGFSRP